MCAKKGKKNIKKSRKRTFKRSFTVDPGWNDPPMLNYTPDNPPPKSRITNKRVAFPLGSTSGKLGGAPQPAVPAAAIPVQELQGVLEKFRMLIGEVDVNERLELEQKLGLLQSSWSEGALPESACKYVVDISGHLNERNLAKVNEVLLKLMMEYGAVCTPWVGLIRRLVVVQSNK